MTNRMHTKSEESLLYNTRIRHKNDDFDIPKNRSEYFTLANLMDSIGNMNHDISIVGYCIWLKL